MNSHDFSSSGPSTNLKRYFPYILFSICLAYALFEYFFIPFSALTADEFVFARNLYEYTYHIPYLDFPPYKSTLGHYLLAIPFFFNHDILAPIFYAKYEIAGLNILFIVLTCIASKTLFDRRAILLALLAVMANQLFLVYASELRVDMLTAWMCLLAILLILQQRPIWCGIILGLAFLISQKALWYILAVNGAVSLCWLLFRQGHYHFSTLVRLNLAILMPIVIYVIFWSLIASPYVVLHNLFYEAYIQAGINVYLPIYFWCWEVILRHGPILYLLWPLTACGLLQRDLSKDALEQRVFVLTVSWIGLLLFISYKQPFPYNFVFTIPALYLMFADFIGYLLTSKYRSTSMRHRIYFGIFLFAAIVYPFIHSVRTAIILDGRYQRDMVMLAGELVQQQEGYVAGIPFLYQRDQSVKGLKNLIEPALLYIQEPNAAMGRLLLPSLYLDPTTIDTALADLKRLPVKVIINNYRIRSLPVPIQEYLNTQYQHFYGSVYLYAPLVRRDDRVVVVKFSGNYRVEGTLEVQLDGKNIANGQLVGLSLGAHLVVSRANFRLVFVPQPLRMKFEPAFREDQWYRVIKAIIA